MKKKTVGPSTNETQPLCSSMVTRSAYSNIPRINVDGQQ